MIKDILALVAALFIMGAAVVFAQPSDPSTVAFERLSPGNQKIAQALFDAQQTPAPGTPGSTGGGKVYTRDEIAAMKQGGQGWGQIFKMMQAQGQLEGAKNLGQVVSGKYQPPAPPAPATGTSSPQVGATATGGGTTPNGNQGAFDRLSPGNQKIARALFDAQQTPAPGTPGSTGSTGGVKVYTRDEIAAMKQGGQGWGGVFREMKAQGQLQDAKNLGQVVSGKYAAPTGSTITTASGRTEVVGGRPSGGSSQVAWQKHGGASPGNGKGAGSSGVSTAAGRSAGGHGHVAHGKSDPGGPKGNGNGKVK